MATGAHSNKHAEERAGPTQHDQDQIDATQQVLLGHGGCCKTPHRTTADMAPKAVMALLSAIATSPKSSASNGANHRSQDG